ncbi:MAG: calcium/sodium antiporter [Nitrospinaceae bacterium]
MLFHLFLLILGLPLLYYGGDLLITGSIRISRNLKISPFIIGATVVGFGTSAPELAVSILAAIQGSPELALGNVIGSNIANVGLVLGLTALIIPLTIGKQRLKEESPPFIFTTGLVMVLVWDSHLNRLEGGIMVVLMMAYLWNSFRKKEESEFLVEEETFLAEKGMGIQAALILAGLGLLIFGAKCLVDGAVGIATQLGISEWFIGITIVALGTSLPEIVSSLMAAKRGHGEMAIGNVVGSNIFNSLLVLGVTASIQPLDILEPIHTDLMITTALSCLLLILIRIEHELSQRDGFILLALYIGYLGMKGMGL